MTKKTRVASIFLTAFATQILKGFEKSKFPREFFEAEPWVDGPNSTQRLTLTTYQALREAARWFTLFIDHYSTGSLSDPMKERFVEYDILILHTIKSKLGIALTGEFLDWIETLPEARRPKLILGTEVTWWGDYQKGVISEKHFRNSHFDHVLLRHTGKDERALHNAKYGGAFDARVQDFNISIDTDVVKSEVAIRDRKTILFVGAPLDREHKNNDAIDEIRRLIDSRKEVAEAGYEILVLRPPYRTVDYWDILKSTAFLVFTSATETFSFLANDARACGVVVLHPQHMYDTGVTYVIAADSFQWLGPRFDSYEDAVEKVVNLIQNPEDLERESAYGRKMLEEHFSVQKQAEDWKNLLTGKSLNNEKLIITDKELPWSEVIALAAANGARFVLAIGNLIAQDKNPEGYSWHDQESGVTLIREKVISHEFSRHRGMATRANPKKAEGSDLMVPHPIASYLQLLCRLNRIDAILLDRDIDSPVLMHDIGSVRILRNVLKPTEPLKFSRISF